MLLTPRCYLAILQVARSGRLCRDAQDMPRSRLPSGASQRFSPALRERNDKTEFRGTRGTHQARIIFLLTVSPLSDYNHAMNPFVFRTVLAIPLIQPFHITVITCSD